MAVTPKNRPDPGRQQTRRRLWMIGLSLFVIADIALVAMALNQPVHLIPDALATPVFSPAPSSTPAPTATSEPPTSLPTVALVSPSRVLEARDGSLAWRATTGPCPDGTASPERTTDAGVTWKPTNATGPTDVVSVQRITIEGSDVASMVGQVTSDCSPSFIRTYVAGDNYARYPADLAGAWYVHPLNRAVVHSPAGEFSAPCENVVAFATIDATQAAVLCDGQILHVTADAAASWSGAVVVPGAMNLTESASGYLIATVSTDPACVGVQLVTLPVDGSASAPTGCFPSSADPQSLAGNIAVSDGDGTVWLWAGDSLVRSSDGGAIWG
jgi:hypothetical protein